MGGHGHKAANLGEKRKGNNIHRWHFLSIARHHAKHLARMVSSAQLATLEAATLPSSLGRDRN